MEFGASYIRFLRYIEGFFDTLFVNDDTCLKVMLVMLQSDPLNQAWNGRG